MMQQGVMTIANLFALATNVHKEAHIAPEHMSTLYNYACQCAAEGDIKFADRLLYALLLLDHSNFDYSLSLGLCRQKQGLHKEALFYFSKAHAIQSADPRPIYHGALSYLKLGDGEGVRRALWAVIQCQPSIDEIPIGVEPLSYQAQCQVLQQKARQLLSQLTSVE